MGVILGFIGVILSVYIGFTAPGGPAQILFQPYEILVVLGTAVSTVIAGAPLRTISAMVEGLFIAIFGSGINKVKYEQLLGLMSSSFDVMRREGVLGIEDDIENPEESERFQSYPKILQDTQVLETFTGALRLFVDGVVNAFDLDKLLDIEIETQHDEYLRPATSFNRLADTLPALGIVAAVLGIIITMQHLDGPPAEIGHHVAAALVGTMMGILLSYGFASPLANKMEAVADERTNLLRAVQTALVAFAGGSPPQVALEFARRTIPQTMRPSAEELDEIIRNAKNLGRKANTVEQTAAY